MAWGNGPTVADTEARRAHLAAIDVLDRFLDRPTTGNLEALREARPALGPGSGNPSAGGR